MKTYSDFFKTLHDEQSPTGYLGRGTHHSVLRAVVFHDASGKHLPRAQFMDFAVIWDEDHDDRVIEPIEKIYRCGLLPRFVMFGERKGSLTAVLADGSRAHALEAALNTVTQHLDSGDEWPARVVELENAAGLIIDDSAERTSLYLRNIVMLWNLGLKAPSDMEKSFNPAFLKSIAVLDLSVRARGCLESSGVATIGDLVQKSEAELLRTEYFGRKSLTEIKETLNGFGLHLGMELFGWPHKNLVAVLAESFED